MAEKMDTGTATSISSVQRRQRRREPSMDNPTSQMTYEEFCRLRAAASNVETDVPSSAQSKAFPA